jgi:hypothetical protein
MSEPWFDAMRYAWIPGTLMGVFGGLLGSLVGTLAPFGKGRQAILGAMWAFIAISAALLVAGVWGLASGQPYGVWYGLGLPGLLGVVLFPSLMPVVRNAYRMAEQRRMDAKDLAP